MNKISKYIFFQYLLFFFLYCYIAPTQIFLWLHPWIRLSRTGCINFVIILILHKFSTSFFNKIASFLSFGWIGVASQIGLQLSIIIDNILFNWSETCLPYMPTLIKGGWWIDTNCSLDICFNNTFKFFFKTYVCFTLFVYLKHIYANFLSIIS